MTETLNQEELMQKIKDLQAENQLLKKKQNKFGLTFKKYPENGEPQRLYAGEIPFLSPRPEYSVVKDTPQRGEHVLIEGDNLSALVALQATHKGKVDVIYIDPPYNTGNKDFVYNDRYVSNDDGFRHSKWLSFMERRLHLAKELLSETGVIMLAIDDNEQAALRLLMDSVFGESNFIANIIWQGGRKNDSRFVSTGHDYQLIYAKNKGSLLSMDIRWRTSKPEAEKIIAAGENAYQRAVTDILSAAKNTKISTDLAETLFKYKKKYDEIWAPAASDHPSATAYNVHDPSTPLDFASVLAKFTGDPLLERLRDLEISPRATKYLRDWFKTDSAKDCQESKHYNRVDGQGRVFFPDNAAAPDKPHTRSHISVVNPSTGEVHPSPRKGWRWSEETLLKFRKDNRLFFSSPGSIPQYKRFLAETSDRVLDSVFYQDRRVSNVELKQILGSGKFDFPKDHQVLARWIGYVSGNNPNAIVLDFFAGSGTTGHAVAALNAADGGNRQCILVTNNFEQDGSPNGIARDVTAARMKAVLTGQWADGKDHDPLPGNLHYYQIEFAPQENEFRAVSTWADADHALGLQAVKDGAFTKVDVSPTDYPELADLIAEGRAALSANETTLFATWFDEMELNLGSELVESFAASALSLGAQLDKKVVFYIPSSWVDDVPDEDFFAGAQAALTYPMPYLNTVNRVIKDLKSGGYLLPLDEAPTDDSLGSEGVPTSPEDAN